MTIQIETLSKYLSDVFVETGTHEGFCVQKALDCGYKKAISVESDVTRYKIAKNKFKGNKNVILFLGNSGSHLSKMLDLVDSPCTIWLDAHQGNKCALLSELNIIKKNHLNVSAILIDDLRLFYKWNLTLQQVKDALLKINGDFKFRLEPGYAQDDILAAYLE